METFGIILLAAVGLASLWAVIALWRQGHPADDVQRDLPEDPGPTGEKYPTGSRPAGPGAERMTAEPSQVQNEVGEA